MQQLRQAHWLFEHELTSAMQVSTHFEVVLPATASFDYPTVAALAAFIASKSAAEAVSVSAPAVAGHVTDVEHVPSTASRTSDLIGMSSMLATSPIPGEGKFPHDMLLYVAMRSPNPGSFLRTFKDCAESGPDLTACRGVW